MPSGDPPSSPPPTPPGDDHPAGAVVSRPLGSAGIGWRLCSWFVDLAVLVLVGILSNIAFDTHPPVATLLIVAFTAAYGVVLPIYRIGTFGHLIFGLRVLNAETGAPAEPLAVIARGMIMLLLAVPVLLGVVATVSLAALTDRNLAIQDAATNTVLRRR